MSDSDQFDRSREGTGTREWAETNYNIGRGCRNGCLYCYACGMALLYQRIPARETWLTETLADKKAFITTYPKREGVIMFPSTHDVTPFYLPYFTRVARLMLAKGNHLLITTKPRLECVEAMLTAFAEYRSQILFRFTIGSTDDGDLAFWESGAPTFAERITALDLAQGRGFETSVSIEPMLAGTREALEVVRAVYPLVTETIWIGKMNLAGRWCDMRIPEIRAAVEGVKVLQCDAAILKLVQVVKRLGFDKVRWKDSIKAIMKVEG